MRLRLIKKLDADAFLVLIWFIYFEANARLQVWIFQSLWSAKHTASEKNLYLHNAIKDIPRAF